MKTIPQTPLTPKELMILDFIKSYLEHRQYAPTYEEIKNKFQFASFFSVQRYLKQLEDKGYIRTPWKNKKRALEIIEQDSPVEIPFLGKVAAGRPIEAIETRDAVEVPPWMLTKRNLETVFALKVEGESMIDDGIHDGDILVIQKQVHAQNGQTVVALIEHEATVKRFYKKGDTVELRPANPTMKSIFVPADKVEISGTVIGLIRSFK